jgi:DNA gyrase subunit A
MNELRIMGRATQGVRLISLKEGDEIASVAKIEHSEEEELEDKLEQTVEGTAGDTSEADSAAAQAEEEDEIE